MGSRKRITAVSAAAAVLCTGVFLTAQSAQADSSYNIMFVGSTIPSGVGSVYVFRTTGGPGSTARGCVSNVRVGQDRNTGMTITPSPPGTSDATLFLYLYGDNQCQGSRLEGKHLVRALPKVVTTKNWWVSLS